MLIGDGFADGQTEACAPGGARAGLIGTVEAVKKMREVLSSDAAATVGDDEAGVIGFGGGA